MSNDQGSSPMISGPQITSELASDPDMAELIGEYLSELEKRVGVINDAMGSSRLDVVQRIAHQLRGASAGYGYRVIGDAAATVEDLLRNRPDPDVESVRRAVDDLLSICQRAMIPGR